MNGVGAVSLSFGVIACHGLSIWDFYQCRASPMCCASPMLGAGALTRTQCDERNRSPSANRRSLSDQLSDLLDNLSRMEGQSICFSTVKRHLVQHSSRVPLVGPYRSAICTVTHLFIGRFTKYTINEQRFIIVEVGNHLSYKGGQT